VERIKVEKKIECRGAGRTGFACKLNKPQFIASQSGGASKQRAKT